MARGKFRKATPSKRITPTSRMPDGRGNDPLVGTLAVFGNPEHLNLIKIGHQGVAPKVAGHVCTGAWKVTNSGFKNRRFQQVAGSLRNTQILYHGTPAPNIAAIIEEGLRPGRSDCMFGSGIYMGPMEKAFNYTGNGQAHYIIEVEAVLGKVWERDSSNHNLTLENVREAGYHSVAGTAGYTTTYGSATLRNSEYVVYSPDQVRAIRVFEYQPDPTSSAADTGGCQVLKPSKNPVPAGMQAFREFYAEVPCGKRPTTRLATTDDKHRTVEVCAECIQRLKLKRGDKIRIRRREWIFRGFAGSSGYRNTLVTVTVMIKGIAV